MYATLGERIKATREMRQMTQAGLSRMMNISPVTLWRIESNQSEPKLEQLRNRQAQHPLPV